MLDIFTILLASNKNVNFIFIYVESNVSWTVSSGLISKYVQCSDVKNKNGTLRNKDYF